MNRVRIGYEPEQKNIWGRVVIAGIGLIFILLIIRFLSGGSSASMETAFVTLKLSTPTSIAQITSSDDKQKEITTNTPLSPLDAVEVKNGTAELSLIAQDKNILRLNTGTKIHYLGQSSDNKAQFRLENKDLWIQSDTSSLTFDLVGINLSPAATSVINVSKNELFTTISVFQGSATIMLGNSTQEIVAGKQLNYSSLKTLSPEDLASRINPINPDNLTSEWMKVNGASAYHTDSNPTTSSVTPIPLGGNTGSMILFDSPIDESRVDAKTITVSGRILSPSVSRVIINGTPATVDPAKQVFTLSNVPLTAKENNLVYRTFDTSGTALSKGVLTIYSTSSTATASSTTGDNRAQVESYKPDNRFKIIAPSTDFFETRDSKVKLEGRVTAGVVHHITVNDTRLKSFVPNGSTWYYFANQQFGNMQEGVNTYIIRYFDSNDSEIYKQLFVIKKLSDFKSVQAVSSEVTVR